MSEIVEVVFVVAAVVSLVVEVSGADVVIVAVAEAVVAVAVAVPLLVYTGPTR